jgi:hypothetical protein
VIDGEVDQRAAAFVGKRLRKTFSQSCIHQLIDEVHHRIAVVDGHQLSEERMGPQRVPQREAPLQRGGLPVATRV